MRNLKKKSIQKIVSMSLGLTLALSLGFGTVSTSAYAASSTTSTSDSIISTAKQYLGTPYDFGSKTGNTSSFDCSSFVQTVFQKNGISLPRDSRQQSQVGTYVPKDQLQPGDLIFFYSPIHHVAIYIGNGQIIHTYGAPGVTISDLNSNWWKSHYTSARRVLPDAGQAVTQNPPKEEPAKNVQPSADQSKAVEKDNTSSVTPVTGNDLSFLKDFLNQNGYRFE